MTGTTGFTSAELEDADKSEAQKLTDKATQETKRADAAESGGVCAMDGEPALEEGFEGSRHVLSRRGAWTTRGRRVASKGPSTPRM